MSDVIQKIMVLDNGHLPEKVFQDLLEEAPRGTFVPFENGFFVHVPRARAQWDSDVPAELAFLIGFARAKGCTWLRLDEDGDRLVDLPYWGC